MQFTHYDLGQKQRGQVVEITLQGNVLTVEYNKVEEENKPDTRYFAMKSFQRSQVLPKECDLNTIVSEYKDGILKISVDKIEKIKEEPEIRKIEIK